MRKDFKMTQEQLDEIMEACKPQPLIAIHCGNPPSPQERANDAWAKLGRELGFKHMTVSPNGKGDKCFNAEVVENWHQGDPCTKCGTPHDDVESGPCPGKI